jgi:HEAT repeat protein
MAYEMRQRADEGREAIQQLVDDLSSTDGMTRQRARSALVRTGEPAVETLIEALRDERQIVRWEAASTLREIRDARAARPLVSALEDEDGDVRWLAAEALAGLKEHALAPLFEALAHPSTSVLLREGAHHVITRLRRGWPAVVAGPVLDALESIDPELAVPTAAQTALAVLGPLTNEEQEE